MILTIVFFALLAWFFINYDMIIDKIGSGFEKILGTISNNISVREPPTIIQEITSSKSSFDLTNLVKFDTQFPYVEGEWLTMISDHDKLTKYASLIDSHRSLAEMDALKATSKFEEDNKLLIDQQRQIFRRAFQAKSLIKRFKELNNLNPSLNNLPKSLQIQMPITPKYLTTKDLDRQYGLLPSNTGHAIGKAINSGGFGSSGNNILEIGRASCRERV